MEIKRTIEFFVETNRQLVIHQPAAVEKVFCPVCGEPTLTAEQAAAFFQTNCRRIYRFVEAGAAHFAETETSAILICPASLGAAISGSVETNDLQGEKK